MYYAGKDIKSLNEKQFERYKNSILKIDNSKRIVLKFGTEAFNSIINRYGDTFSENVSNYLLLNKEIIIVSSGAIGLGKKTIQLNEKDETIKRAVYASIGQPLLMSEWNNIFNDTKITISQMLYQNENLFGTNKHIEYIKKCLESSIRNGIVPIINENDAVTSDEISGNEKSFGDNDNLAMLITKLVNADLLIYFTVSGGIYSDLENGKKYKAMFSDSKIGAKFKNKKSELGTGGLESKLSYSYSLAKSGIPVIITGSSKQHCLRNALENHNENTIIVP